MKKPLVLVVDADAKDLEWEKRFLEDVLEEEASVCRGPGTDRECPLITGLDCSKLHAADGILFELDLDKEVSRRILQRYTEVLDIPIRVVATPEDVRRYSTLLSRVEVVDPPIGPAKLDAFAAEVEAETD
jgi:hypothetical protein